jgi:hypothetical protein
MRCDAAARALSAAPGPFRGGAGGALCRQPGPHTPRRSGCTPAGGRPDCGRRGRIRQLEGVARVVGGWGGGVGGVGGQGVLGSLRYRGGSALSLCKRAPLGAAPASGAGGWQGAPAGHHDDGHGRRTTEPRWVYAVERHSVRTGTGVLALRVGVGPACGPARQGLRSSGWGWRRWSPRRNRSRDPAAATPGTPPGQERQRGGARAETDRRTGGTATNRRTARAWRARKDRDAGAGQAGPADPSQPPRTDGPDGPAVPAPEAGTYRRPGNAGGRPGRTNSERPGPGG